MGPALRSAFPQWDRAIVDAHVGTERLRSFELIVAARRDDRARAGVLGEEQHEGRTPPPTPGISTVSPRVTAPRVKSAR